MKKQAICATLLALGASAVLGTSTAGAAAGPCKGNDDLRETATQVPNGLWYLDVNANGFLCYHDGGNSKKTKPAGSWYYDDRV